MFTTEEEMSKSRTPTWALFLVQHEGPKRVIGEVSPNRLEALYLYVDSPFCIVLVQTAAVPGTIRIEKTSQPPPY
jgi:hypothetical protein